MAESNVNGPWQIWQSACMVSGDRVVGGHPKPHIWNQQPQFAYSLCNFYGATMTIKGSLHECTPIVKRFSVKIFLSPESGPKIVFRELRGVDVKLFNIYTP